MASEAKAAELEAKTDNSSDKSVFADETSKLMTEIIQPLTKGGAALDRAEQTVYS